MADLRVPSGPGLPHGLTIPEGELLERFSRSSGPGGQSVNTTDSRVELVFDHTISGVLSDTQRERLRRTLGADPVRVVASEHKSQRRNRDAARTRLAGLLRDALTPPVPRVPTKPTRGSKRRRLEAKKQRSQTKALRGRVR